MGKGASAVDDTESAKEHKSVKDKNLTARKVSNVPWKYHHGLCCYACCSPTLWFTINFLLLIVPATYAIAEIIISNRTNASADDDDGTNTNRKFSIVQWTSLSILLSYLIFFFLQGFKCVAICMVDRTDKINLNAYHYAVSPRVLEMRWSLWGIVRYFWCPCARKKLNEHLTSTKFSYARNQWELLNYFRRLTIAISICNSLCSILVIVDFAHWITMSKGISVALFVIHLLFPRGEFLSASENNGSASTPSAASVASGDQFTLSV